MDRDLNVAKNIKQVGASTCRGVEVNLSFREFSAYHEAFNEDSCVTLESEAL